MTVNEHECRCHSCDPEEFGFTERQGQHHFSIYFGHVGDGIVVTVDGREVQCYETFVGPEGKVHTYSAPSHKCGRCGVGRCATVERGDTRITGVVEPPVANPIRVVIVEHGG